MLRPCTYGCGRKGPGSGIADEYVCLSCGVNRQALNEPKHGYWTFAEAEHVQRFLDGLRTVMWLWAYRDWTARETVRLCDDAAGGYCGDTTTDEEWGRVMAILEVQR